jgi:hypothetical protein
VAQRSWPLARSMHRSVRDTAAQVHILEAKNLAARDSGGTSDPIVIVEAFGDKRHTKAKEKMLNCTAAWRLARLGIPCGMACRNAGVWNEFFYMEFDVKSVIDFKTAKIKISVFDVNKFLPNVLVRCSVLSTTCVTIQRFNNAAG